MINKIRHEIANRAMAADAQLLDVDPELGPETLRDFRMLARSEAYHEVLGLIDELIGGYGRGGAL